jgi:copper(I)-binding protein
MDCEEALMNFRFFGKASLAIIGLILSFVAPASALEVTVKDAWIRGTVPGQNATGAFMEITSRHPARLIGASTPAAGVVEIHNMKMENGVMRMFPVTGIDVPAGKHVKLAPGGYHVMMMSLRQPLTAGDKVPLTLTFESADKKRETIELSVEVRDITGGRGHGH